MGIVHKKIHFVGIKGVGMTPLAIIAKEAGCMVTGSDLDERFITDVLLNKAGIIPLVGFSPEHVSNVDLVITTGAHGGYNNPEVLAAKEKGIPVISQGEAVGVFMDGEIFGRKQTGISIAGTHGKTTTTAMVATVLKENNMDPSFVVGTGSIPSLGSAGHYGKGKYFVAEADEYATEPKYDKRAKFLWQHPKIAVFTNIEHDHPDIYPSLASMHEAFMRFAQQLSSDSLLIACGDDNELQKLIKNYTGKKILYGFSPVNDFIIERIHISGRNTFFTVKAHFTELGEFMIQVPGEHNALNSLAAVIVGLEVGLPLDKVKNGIKQFLGTKRRLELIGTLETGALLFDDYAHHPTEIKKTLHALRQMYPKKQIICFFQPHTYSRTKSLFEEFTRVFTDVDTVGFVDIFPSAREDPDPSVSSRLLTETTKRLHKNVIYLPNLDDVLQYVNEKKYGPDSVIITMGAGDVYKIAEQFKFEARSSKS